MSTKKRKIFVLDTNVILHDSSCLHNFQENDIVLPITVLEELDQFKKGNATINYHAREFIRTLDALSQDAPFGKGATIGAGHGKIFIELERKFHQDLALNFSPQKADHQILNIAYHYAQECPERQVILITKDGNLRLKARSVGLVSEDYTSDQVQDISTLYTGRRIEEEVQTAQIDQMYQAPYEIPASVLAFDEPLRPHEFIIMRNGRKSVLATYDPFTETIKRVDKTSAYGITPRNAEQSFALHALLDDQIQLVSLSGKAGTGKTLLALAAGLERRKSFRQIFMARPVVPLSNKDLGFLPGDIQSKLEPYMQPLYDNLSVIQSESDSKHRCVKEFLEEEKLLISPLSYIRGRSLVKVYFIVDEAQNLTPHEVKTIITRAGEGTKMVFTGDIFQIDHPYLDSQSNGLSYLIERMKGQKLYAHITLEKGERSELAELAGNLL
ncbi:ribonuclease [candidate division KSB3 bacterium]|uniref:Ribonuclease n=1 Tax=candidate division KSB3 bacterium TaxID=2044937 RepID=A0A2G6E5I6_9BACT|nr:MAG: ribonuclease [candidate division KSB3 bacterium]PIE29869.1 MAG: ribonuclease [candidate division KSB3 bacterium]